MFDSIKNFSLSNATEELEIVKNLKYYESKNYISDEHYKKLVSIIFEMEKNNSKAKSNFYIRESSFHKSFLNVERKYLEKKEMNILTQDIIIKKCHQLIFNHFNQNEIDFKMENRYITYIEKYYELFDNKLITFEMFNIKINNMIIGKCDDSSNNFKSEAEVINLIKNYYSLFDSNLLSKDIYDNIINYYLGREVVYESDLKSKSDYYNNENSKYKSLRCLCNDINLKDINYNLYKYLFNKITNVRTLVSYKYL